MARSPMFFIHVLTSRTLGKNIKRYGMYRNIMLFNKLVTEEHICPFCGRKFKTYGAIITHLMKDYRCSSKLVDIINSVIYNDNSYKRKLKMIDKKIQSIINRAVLYEIH